MLESAMGQSFWIVSRLFIFVVRKCCNTPGSHTIMEKLVTCDQCRVVNRGSTPAVKGQAMLRNFKLHVPTFETLL